MDSLHCGLRDPPRWFCGVLVRDLLNREVSAAARTVITTILIMFQTQVSGQCDVFSLSVFYSV